MVSPGFLLTATVVLAAAIHAATTGQFSVLSMNVAGLPAIFNGNDVPGDKKTNAQTIGSKFAEYDYDIIHVQEDFNYHAYIYDKDDHPQRTSTSGGAGIGSGLNTLSNFVWTDFTRVKWNSCSDASGWDCLTPKGFTFMRMTIADGVDIDLYNLHADAGTENGDEIARTSNIQQVVDYIATWSSSNAVLVFGDTNSRYSRTADNIRILSTSASLSDAWIMIENNGNIPATGSLCDNPSLVNTCETVDKIFYRGNDIVDLTALSFNYDSTKFVQPNGDILSDHNPVNVTFAWSLSSTRRRSIFTGGPHGTWFNDLTALPPSTPDSSPTLKVSSLTLRGGSRLDSVALTLSPGGQTLTHGGTGGCPVTLALAANEYWTEAKLCQGQYNGDTRNFYLQAKTSQGQVVQVGTETQVCNDVVAEEGWQIVGFLGQSGDEVDQLGFVFAPQ